MIRIAGPPGIGKTTFLNYLLAHLPARGRTLTSRTQPSERTSHAATVRVLLGIPTEAGGDDGLRAALDAAVCAGATIAIDDAQWLDEISERLLRGVIRRHRPGGDGAFYRSQRERTETAPTSDGAAAALSDVQARQRSCAAGILAQRRTSSTRSSRRSQASLSASPFWRWPRRSEPFGHLRTSAHRRRRSFPSVSSDVRRKRAK